MKFEITPQFAVTGTMFEVATAGLAAHAPDVPPLTWESFAAASGWVLIPDAAGELAKAERTFVVSEARTVRLNVWFRPDLRGGTQSMPHSHPWATFTGHVLAGGYSEDRYVQQGTDIRANLGIQHTSPAANTVDHATYHEVTAVHEPGRTVSLMVCGPGRRGDWGYLNTDTGQTVRDQPVHGFDAMLRALNPHRM